MAKINEYIAGILSAAAYGRPGAPVTVAEGVRLAEIGWIDITEALAPQVGQPYFNSDPTNFTNEFRILVNTDNQLVIAFKGSKQIENFLSDLNPTDLGYSQYSLIATQAQAYYDFLMLPGGKYAGYTVFTDGHSLGGGMAQSFAVQNNLNGFGQNSLPISPNFISLYTNSKSGNNFAADLAIVQASRTFDEVNVGGDIATLTYDTLGHGTYLNQKPRTLTSLYTGIEIRGG